MKILVVSQCIPPTTGGSSSVIENLAENFRREEMVLLGGKSIFERSPAINVKDERIFGERIIVNI